MKRVTVEVAQAHHRVRFSRRDTLRTVSSVLRTEPKAPRSVSIVFVGSRKIRAINRTFLGHDYVTDVISFPLQDGMGLDGEVYVNLDRARSQAREYGIRFTEEIRRLLIHGTLHLSGYDDRTKRQRARMRKREEWYLRKNTRTTR